MPRNNLSAEVVVNAAIELADKEGLRELSLKKLAENLNVKPPALYNHIRGIEDIQTKLAVRGLTELGAVMSDAAVGQAEDDALQAVGKAYLAFAKNHPGLYESTQWTNLWNNDPRVIEASDQIISLLERILSPYGFNDEELCSTIRAFRSLCHGFASLDMNGGFGNPLVDPARSFDEALALLLAGMHSRYAR